MFKAERSHVLTAIPKFYWYSEVYWPYWYIGQASEDQRNGVAEDTIDLSQCVVIHEEENKPSSHFYNNCRGFRKTAWVLAYAFFCFLTG